ncbi:hypothetical protein HYDPIDRAFT_29213 [Hydnomerulius pinastri MD-312]|uniref:Uncharacterized protein n=1 Tax=Hydnomerulius pinastri MD-312 TaxID=994086 RepID=A0A0C9W8L3_9AGAM|nr:hypothetical protein HYDPIDRAFT_29213 [Hydnomerulius pinastri MD-312]
MASLLSAVRRHAPLHAFRLAQRAVLVRQMHTSPPARLAHDDVDDLFGSLAEPEPKAKKSRRTTSSLSSSSGRRERQFDTLLQFVSDRSGRVKVVKAGQVSPAAWSRLFQLAKSAEQLGAVVEIFPQWRDSGKSFSSLTAEKFIQRCEELQCSHLALPVFADHAKYGLPLPSLPAARQLLHCLYKVSPVETVVAAASLFGVYKLPPVTSDAASCAMLYAACVRSKTENAKLLADSLRPPLKKLLSETKPFTEPKGVIRGSQSVKPDIWLLEALEYIEKNSGRAQEKWIIRKWLALPQAEVAPQHLPA